MESLFLNPTDLNSFFVYNNTMYIDDEQRKYTKVIFTDNTITDYYMCSVMFVKGSYDLYSMMYPYDQKIIISDGEQFTRGRVNFWITHIALCFDNKKDLVEYKLKVF